jgi:tyrosinase
VVDPGGDAMTSPGDPVFYFHHGALDRLWWLWQMQDPDNRLNAYVSLGVGGMSGMHHRRQSDPDDAWIDMEWLAPKIKLTEANDQLGGNNGALCYIYV